jgi:putative transcriptional regulator
MPQPPRTRASLFPAHKVSPGSRCVPGLAALVAFVTVALTAIAVTPGRSAEPRSGPGSLAGQLLVATPEMQDARFARTVIYMVRHDASGAQGLVVNRPLREIPLAVLLEQTGMESKGVQGTVRLHAGGPVEALRIFVLHTAEYMTEGTLPVKDGIALTLEPDILRAIAQDKGPRRAFFALGCAGWAPGQLDAEMKTGAWVRASADEALLFDLGYDTKWDRAMARRKIDL